MGLVENIRELCKESGISVPKLEKELSFGNGAIYTWNKSSPSIDKVQKVANYMKVSVDRVMYGFDLTKFSNLVRLIRGDRPIEQFAAETGVNIALLFDICAELLYERPSRELIKQIMLSNPTGSIVSEDDLLEAAAYVNRRSIKEVETIAAHHDGEDWTEEELEEIERFKEFVKMKRKQQG